jgi:hypothetical protein
MRLTRLFAAILFLFGFMISAGKAEPARIIGSLGMMENRQGADATLRYVGAPLFWGIQPVVGIGVGRNGSGFVGIGSGLTWRPNDGAFFIRATSMIGVHRRGNGYSLGGPVNLRSNLDLGMMVGRGAEIGLGIDHRSHAGLYRNNPGLNSAYLFASFPLN